MKSFPAVPIKTLLGAFGALALALSTASAEVLPFPRNFRVQDIQVEGATIHVRIGGKGPAVVMLHGFGDTGDMWAPVAAVLVQRSHRDRSRSARHGSVVSSRKRLRQEDASARHRASDGQAERRQGRFRHPRHRQHGRLRASPRNFPSRVTRWVAIDAPLPGIGPWDEILRNPLLWHFNFRGPDAERLVKGRERIYLDRFWNELSANPQGDRRGNAAPLCGALCAARRHAFGVQSIRRLHAGCGRQQGACGQGQVGHADAWRLARSIHSARKWPTTCVSWRPM